MPTLAEWRRAIQDAAEGRRNPVTALTYLDSWGSASRPVLLGCDDQQSYVVKGRQNQKMIVADHIIGRLGLLLEAPVGEVYFVDVPSALIAVEPKLAYVPPGLSHGTRFVPDCTDKMGIAHTDQTENRARFARLAVLYSWVLANDPQCIYQKSLPYLVYSVDHGHFFHSGPNWTVASFASSPAATLDQWFAVCTLTPDELSSARQNLGAITDQDIEAVVAAPPDDWGVSAQERTAIRDYLVRRRTELLQVLPAAA